LVRKNTLYSCALLSNYLNILIKSSGNITPCSPLIVTNVLQECCFHLQEQRISHAWNQYKEGIKFAARYKAASFMPTPCLFFDLEGGGNMFFGNVRSLRD
jgi:hypothetical protein